MADDLERGRKAQMREQDVMRGFPPAPQHRITPATAYTPPFTRWFLQHAREVERTASVGCRAAEIAELPTDPRDLSDLRILIPARTGPGAGAGGGSGESAAAAGRSGEAAGAGPRMPASYTVDEVLRLTHTDAFLVMHRGVIVDERYFNTMTPETPHMWQSISKSLISCVAGNLADRGIIDPGDDVLKYVPELAGSAYEGATLRDLLDMRVGIDFVEDYDDLNSEAVELDRLYGVRQSRLPHEPGSSYEFATRTRPKGRHGGDFHYVSLNTNVLGWALERATGIRVPELIRDEVWSKLGAEHEAYIALDGAGSAQSEGGFCASLRDMARFTQMVCGGGRFNGRQVVPAVWIDDIRRNGDKQAFAGSHEATVMHGGSYRSCFWVSQSTDHTALMGSGIFGQMLYANAEAEVAVAKFSTQEVADDPHAFVFEFHLFEQLAEALAG